MPRRPKRYAKRKIVIENAEYLNVQEAGKLLGYGDQYIRDLALTRKLNGIKRRRRWFFCKKDVLAFLNGEQPKREKISNVQSQGEIEDCDFLR